MLLKIKQSFKNLTISRIRIVLLLLSSIPAIYLLIVIQYSAITVPFWDHAEMVLWISSWYDGTLRISSLWAPHNETRPFVYRVVMLFNAILTNWDIRSEYVYMYATIYGTFLVHLFALHKLTYAKNSLVFPTALLLISLLIFSPVGHNNHWWSMMFQLTVANMLIAFGLLVTFLIPGKWYAHMLGVASCWLAAYSLTNGLFAFLAVIATLHFTTRKLLRPDRYTVFWITNFVAIVILYIPGIHPGAGIRHPSLGSLVWFFFVYLGAPLGSIIYFPFKSQFDIPISTAFNGVCGVILVFLVSLLIWHAKGRLRNRYPPALILLGFSLFAGGSALATGWGRAAFDTYGVSNANSSRYTIFAVYLLLGMIYYVSSGFLEGWGQTATLSGKRWGWKNRFTTIGIVAFVILSSITYIRAVKVYVDAHNFNRMLINAYTWGLKPTDMDKYIYPNPDFVLQLKSDLQRLQIGPYSVPHLREDKLIIGKFKYPFPLYGNKILSQEFRANEQGLKMIGVTMVTWGNKQVSYNISWQLFDITAKNPISVAKGNFNSLDVADWQQFYLRLPYLSDSSGRLYQIRFSAKGKSDNQNTVGLALYGIKKTGANFDPVVARGIPASDILTLALQLDYVK